MACETATTGRRAGAGGLSAVLLMTAAWLATGDARPSAREQAPVPAFTSETELVVMNVVVRDRRGAYVSGLPQQAFRLLENGVRQPIALFTHQDAPVTIGLVIDSSGSMQVNRARLAYAAAQFALTGNPDDEIFALVVGDTVKPVLPAERPFTSDPVVLQDGILRALGPQGRTAVWDGVTTGLDYLARGSHARRALVVISDGDDNASTTSFKDVLLRTQASNAAVYTVGMVDPIAMERHPRTLRDLALASGGEVYFPETHVEALAALDDIAHEIRSAYTLGFPAPPATRDARYHRLKVEVAAADGRSLTVRTRAGYLSGGLPRTASAVQ